MPRRLTPLILLLLPAFAGAGPLPVGSGAWAAENLHPGNASWLESTYLIELKQGSRLSTLAQGLSVGGYETSTGDRVDFRHWYTSRWTDASIGWMTQVSPNFGLLYGFSTGERAPKYVIAPSLKLGFLMQAPTGRQGFLSLRVTTRVGGQLKEKSCIADYGDIGGVQTVNCRLAATPLPPEQTLAYLVRAQPEDRLQAMLMFSTSF